MAVYDLNGNNIAGKDFTGKTFVTFGDSITWYDGHSQSGVDVNGYQYYLRQIGFTVTNKGVSGASIAYHSGGYTDICETVTSTDCSGYDYAFVAGGVNDYQSFPSEIGELASSNYSNTTVIGALQIIIEKIVTDNPDIKLFMMTPLREAYNGTNCDNPNSKGNTLGDYADAIRLVAKHYSIPVLDFNAMSGVNEKNLSALTIDNLHLNNAGYAFVSEKLETFVEGL